MGERMGQTPSLIHDFRYSDVVRYLHYVVFMHVFFK